MRGVGLGQPLSSGFLLTQRSGYDTDVVYARTAAVALTDLF